MKNLISLKQAVALCATLFVSTIGYAQEKVSVEAQLSPDDHFGNLWAGDAGDFLGSKLIINGREACREKGLDLKILEAVQMTIETKGLSEVFKEEEESWNSPKLFLSAPSGLARATAICE